MTRALVVKVYGDQTWGQAIANGISDSQRALVAADMQARIAAEAREGVKQPREARYWRERLAEANAAYSGHSEPLRAFRPLLVGWAMLWYGIDMAYKRLSAMNRR